MNWFRSIVIPLAVVFASVSLLRAEIGAEGWLRYAAVGRKAATRCNALPKMVISLGNSDLLNSAKGELVRGIGSMLEKRLRAEQNVSAHNAIVIGKLNDMRVVFGELDTSRSLGSDGFWLRTLQHGGKKYWLIIGGSDRGVLYGTFAFLSWIAQQRSIDDLDEFENPLARIRWASQWDNLDGSIERGYAGRSIFFDNRAVRSDLTRAGEYARLLASVGINSCAINNVNADPRILSADFLPQLARVADAFRPWGVRLALSVDLSSPMAVGGLKTFDPLDNGVAEWWKKKVGDIYERIPDFAGFVVKADSEGRSGPSQYGRTAADAANVIARALKPHGGILMYRAFVYNHHLDWRDMKADRAKAAYDYFHPLDGKFDDNVVLQIKYGPIDFQVREPASPLFGAMQHTNEAIELQVTQEYTGQQRHLCFLAAMWKQILDFDMHVHGASPVKEIVEGKTGRRPLGGFNAVVNVGLDENWLAHPLAMANLYAYGRLAWNPSLSAPEVSAEWTRLTFGNNPQVVTTISGMQLSSWRIYESYTGPLGVGTLTDILGSHYEPNVDSAEHNGWGQWIRADANGVGMDRTTATGTGYIAQYSTQVQKKYENLASCPDELLLFMHHVAYTYVLHSGKTVIQHIYDSHYDGAKGAARLVGQWESMRGEIDKQRYEEVLNRLKYQAGQAIVWRDTVVNWFFNKSGIPDAKGRVAAHN
ncbi:MAG: alpha-glucuronidase family glycosyl hydrolase [Terriglobales bacterium]